MNDTLITAREWVKLTLNELLYDQKSVSVSKSNPDEGLTYCRDREMNSVVTISCQVLVTKNILTSKT